MKRIYLVLLLLFVASAAYSQDLNEDQKDLRQRIIDKLEQMRLKPEIDIDGTVFFQKDGRELYVSVDPGVISRPFLISMYYGSSYDSGTNARVTRANLETALPSLNSELPRVKVVIEDEYYLVSSEMYASSAVAIEKMIDDISYAVGEINSEYLNSVVEKHLEEQMEAERRQREAEARMLRVSVRVLSDQIADILGDTTVSFNMILVKGFHDAVSGKDYDYRIGETEVTQKLWLAVMGQNPSYNGQGTYKDPTKLFPVENVSYSEIEEFLNRLNEITSEEYHFRLPEKAEWIFAAKEEENNENEYSGGKAKDVAVYGKKRPEYVKSKNENKFGIFDMFGNVYEWCSDGPEASSKYALGGSYLCEEDNCKIDEGNSFSEKRSDLGFRLIMDLKK